jgi:sterol desaturase/sphingolipid hydroxylase (fatty acid hydroxylase superfamily)
MHKPEKRFFSDWPVYKFLGRHHYLHHKHPDKNFNVVLPLADYVLGTIIRASNLELNEMYRLRLL